jgi:alpha-tubulin suppressor-like RCC1 family protein
METVARVAKRTSVVAFAIASLFVLVTCDVDKLTGTRKVEQAELDALFSISGDSLLALGGTETLALTSAQDLSHTITRWSSKTPAVATVDSITGVVTGVSLGTATLVARLLAPELDTGYARTLGVRVKYKGIRIAAIDSIAGLGLSRAVLVHGTDAADAIQPAAITGVTLTSRDTNTVRVNTGTVVGRKAGDAWVVADYDQLRDSVQVRVRPVPRTVTFASNEYVVSTLNVDRQLSVTVRDQGDSIISPPPVTWRVADSTIATIGATTGILRVLKADTTRIYATADTVTRSQKLLVRQVVASLDIADGDGQSAPVGTLLPVAAQVVARDSAGTPVAGASVIFTPSGNGSVNTGVITTDANGVAAVDGWRLGTTAGAQTLVASVGSVTKTFTATASAGAAERLTFVSQPTSVAVGGTISTVVVAATDTLGNTVSSATGTVDLALQSNPGSATLGGTLSVALTNGVATFNNLTLDATGAGYTLAASGAGLASTVSNSFDAFGAAARVAFVTSVADGVVNQSLAPVRVQVQDANGIGVAGATNAVSLTVIAGPSQTIAGTTTVSAVNGIATFNDLSFSTAGSGYQLRASATNLATTGNSSIFSVEAVGPPTRLGFTAQPGNTSAGASLNASGIKVAMLDANGSTVTTAPATLVTLSIGTNAGGDGTLSGTTSQVTVNGVATFSGMSINRVGSGYVLTATATGVASASSASFNVTAGAVNKLRFVQQPTNAEINTAIAPAVIVAVSDASDNTISTSNLQVTLTANNCTGFSATPVNAASGVATLADAKFTVAGNNCTLTASATGLTAATSQPFSAVPVGGATRLAFTNAWTNGVAGQTLDTIRVALVSAQGVTVPSASTSVTLTLSTGTLGGTLTQPTTNGVAKFGNIIVNTAGAAHQITATSTGFRSVPGSTIAVAAGVPSRLAFATQPANVAAGSVMTPGVQVAVQDAQGNTVTSATTPVQLGLAANPGSATLDGVTTVAASNGIATFDNVRLSKSATGYALSASSPGSAMSGATSATFNVTSSGATGLKFIGQPGTAIASVALNPAVQVQVVDAAGNPIAGVSTPVTLALSGGTAGAILGGTRTVTSSNGVATFSDITVDQPGTDYRLHASASGLSTTASNAFEVKLGTPTKLVLRAQPTLMVAAPATGVIQVAITDDVGNTIPTATADVTLALTSGSGTLGGTLTRATVNGVATFDDISFTPAGTYAVTATSNPAFAQVTTNTITVAPQELAIAGGNTQTGTVGANLAAGPTVRVLDGSGAPVSDVSVTFTTTGTGTLNNSSATIATVLSDGSGLASVTWKLRTAAGTDTLRAALTSTAAKYVLFTATANPGPVTALTKVTGDGQLWNAGSALPVAPRVKVADAFGNGVSGVSVTFTPAAGSGSVGAATVSTNASGFAQTSWTLGATPGAQTLTAAASGLTTNFGAIATTSVSPMSPVSVGYRSSCRLNSNAEIRCWGANLAGQLGDGTTTSRLSPVTVQGGIPFYAVAAGHDHTCAIAGGGAAYCWGSGGNGRLGDGTFSSRLTPTAVTGGYAFQMVSAGAATTCGVTTAGVGLCWGSNYTGQVGDNTTTDRAAPTPIAGGLTFQAVYAGWTHSCGLTTTGAAYCWGANFSGQLGDQTTNSSNQPVPVAGGLTFKALAVGNLFTCGITTAGAGYCWGNGGAGQLGDGSFQSKSSPSPLSGGLVLSAITAGQDHACAIATNSVGYCWGYNVFGQLADGTNINRGAPVLISGGLLLTAISANMSYHTCAIATNGTTQCWGQSAFGETGDGLAGFTMTPGIVSGAGGYDRVDVGDAHTCAITTAGTGYCWGFNADGRVGDGSLLDRAVPTAVNGGLAFQAISAGWYNNSCGLASGAAYCWGSNYYGHLGDGTFTQRSAPSLVTGGLSFQSISVGARHTCAITTGSVMYCWGENYSGQLGNNSTSNTNTPSPVGGFTFTKVASGRDHTCALTAAGAAYCWGFNGSGQLGDGTTTDRHVPVAVLGGFTFVSITAGGDHTCALTAGGTAYCWGSNGSGRLGDGTFSNRSTPGPVSGGLSFSLLSAGAYHTCGVTTTGAAYCWGDNFQGQLGDGTTTNRTGPVSVSGGYSMTSISAGTEHSCGVTTAGSMYCWGLRNSGVLGDGQTSIRRSPVQVIGL